MSSIDNCIAVSTSENNRNHLLPSLQGDRQLPRLKSSSDTTLTYVGRSFHLMQATSPSSLSFQQRFSQPIWTYSFSLLVIAFWEQHSFVSLCYSHPCHKSPICLMCRQYEATAGVKTGLRESPNIIKPGTQSRCPSWPLLLELARLRVSRSAVQCLGRPFASRHVFSCRLVHR